MLLVAKAWHGKAYLSLYAFTFFWCTTWSFSWYLLLCGRCGGGGWRDGFIRMGLKDSAR